MGPFAYLGTVDDASGFVQAECINEQSLASHSHPEKARTTTWRYKPCANVLEYWIKPDENLHSAVIEFLQKRGITPKTRQLIPFVKNL